MDAKGTKGILALVAALLAANLAATLLRPRVDQPAAGLFPSATAGEVLRMDSGVLITTNESGDRLTVWQLGKYVNDGYDSVKSQTFHVSTARP